MRKKQFTSNCTERDVEHMENMCVLLFSLKHKTVFSLTMLFANGIVRVHMMSMFFSDER